jgi:hypothetical protein
MGVPEKMAKDDKTFKAIKEAALQAAQKKAQAEELAMTGQTARNLAEIPIDMNHAGGKLAQAMGGY